MAENHWSWNDRSVSKRLALKTAAIGTDEPCSALDTPHEVRPRLAQEYGARLQTELSPLNRMMFSGDWQPRIASRQGGSPIVPMQRVALQLWEMKHTHPAGTYFAESARNEPGPEVYEIPSLQPGTGTIRAERLNNDNEPIQGFYDRTTKGRELRSVDFERHASLGERRAAIEEIIEASPVDVRTATELDHPVEIGKDGTGVIIPRQQGKLAQAYLATALYAVCLATARQESGTAPSARVTATHTLAAAWTVNMAFAGACLGQWPSAPKHDLKTAGQMIKHDPTLLAAALDLNHKLERSLITRRAPRAEQPGASHAAAGARRPTVRRKGQEPEDVSADAEPAPPPRARPDFRKEPAADRDGIEVMRR